MKLIEVFNQLTSGELSQLCIGGVANGEITPVNHAKVIDHINLALTEIYKRFYLKEGRVALSMVPGRLIYPVHSNYLNTNSASQESVKYLQNLDGYIFSDSVFKIESVLTDADFDIPLNDVLDPLSIATISPTVLRLPAALVAQSINLPNQYKTGLLTLVYRANHPRIDVLASNFDPETLELELPESHLEALLFYVASRVNTPIGMVNEFNAGNNYASKYEMICQRLETYNFQIDHNNSNHRLVRNGWV